MAVTPSRLSTETPFFQDLSADIKRGQIKIPQFQRKFVWKEEQAFKLLDSIKKQLPDRQPAYLENHRKTGGRA